MKKRFLSLILALSMMPSLSACGSENETIPYTFDEVVTMFSDTTNLDELMTISDPITIYSEDESEELDFSTAIKELEERIKLSQELSSAGVKASEEATDTLKEKYSNLTFDDIKLLLDSLATDDLKDVEEARIKAGLSLIAAQNQNWLQTNGLNISEKLLKSVIKAAACEASGLEIEYYDACSISAEPNAKNENQRKYVQLTDPISEEKIEYEIVSPLFGDNILAAALNTLYNIQSLDKPSYDSALTYCQDALECSKLMAASKVELNSKDEISSEKSSKDAKTLILEKAAPSATKKED